MSGVALARGQADLPGKIDAFGVFSMAQLSLIALRVSEPDAHRPSSPGHRMREQRDLHRIATLVMSAAMALLGVAILAVTLTAGGGPLTLGFLLGVLFVGAGGGRFYVTWRHL